MPAPTDALELTPSRILTVSPHPIPSALALTQSRDVAEFRAGQFICREGDQSEALHIVESGMVKVTRRTPRGAQIALGVLGPGEAIGELSLLDGGERSASAQAITPVRLQSIPSVALTDLCNDLPEVRAWLLRLLARRLRRATVLSADLVFKDVSERVADVLLDLAHRFGQEQAGSVIAHHGLTQTELAQLVGTTRESANKALAVYVRRGWISLAFKTLVIHDEAALRQRVRESEDWTRGVRVQ